MSVFSSLTNRIFIASAVLVLGSIVVPVYFVNIAVTEQANTEVRRGLDEAALLVNDYVTQRFESYVQIARTVADLPKLKSAVSSERTSAVLSLSRYAPAADSATLMSVPWASVSLLATARPA